MKNNKKIIVLIFALVIVSIFLVGCSGEDIQNKIEGIYKPTNIKYDGVNISWDKVSIADHYAVQINGGAEQRVNTNVFNYPDTGVAFTVTVLSYRGDKSQSETKTFTPLAQITEINVSNTGVLSWSAVSGASGYKISINEQIANENCNVTEYALSAGNQRVKIMPVVSGNDSFYSKWSETRTVNVYAQPTNIEYDGHTITWNGGFAPKFDVDINGQVQTVNSNSLVYNSNNTSFDVKINAVGDYTNNFDSKETEELFTYLAPVTSINVADGNLLWDATVNAEGYIVKINGVEQPAITTSTYDKLSAGVSHEIAIKPYNNDGKYFSSWSSVKSVFILDAPTVSWNNDLELDGEARQNYTWDFVSGAAGYTVEVTKDGVSTENNFAEAQRAFNFAYEEVGVYTIKVKAVAGLGVDKYDSKYSIETVVERLDAPDFAPEKAIASDALDVKAGFTVNYTPVANARGYQLYKDGVLLNGKFTTTNSLQDNNVADDSIFAQQEYTYIVRSMGGREVINSKNYVYLPSLTEDSLSFNITVQAMPTNLTMSGFYAQWSAVSGNNGYGVTYAGTKNTASTNEYNLEQLNAGKYEVAVYTKGNGTNILASNYTGAVAVDRLACPTNIRISYGAGEGELLFNEVVNAKSYQVFIDQSDEALAENAYDNMYQYIEEMGSVLHMVAEANYYNTENTVYYMTSQATTTQQFVRLATPEFPDGAFANSTEIVWTAPDNINTQEYTPTYQLFESGVMETGGEQNGTKYSIGHLAGGKTYVFTVKAVGNDTKYLDSAISSSISVYKLATPEIVIKDGKYTWQSIANASSYRLEIDGVRVDNEAHVSGSEYSYTPKFDTIGDHTVKLVAIGDGYNNINSDPFTMTQEVKACLAPEFTYAYSGDEVVNGGSITATVTVPSANANGYLFEIAGESIESNSLSVTKPMESSGSYIVRVKAKGGAFDSQNTYYIDSQFAGGESTRIILLAAPTRATFTINSDGAIRWNVISNSVGYNYQIAFDEGAYSATTYTGVPALNPIANFRDYSTIKVKVQAKGNGDKIISSTWVEYIWDNPHK